MNEKVTELVANLIKELRKELEEEDEEEIDKKLARLKREGESFRRLKECIYCTSLLKDR